MNRTTIHPPRLTESARNLLAGRAVHVRSSPRHGCCGGSASVPIAEPTTRDEIAGAERFDVAGTVVHVDGELRGTDGPWTVDTDGFARWRRLVVLGVDLSPR